MTWSFFPIRYFITLHVHRLELEDLLLRVAQLLQDTGQLALVGRAVLGATDGLVHAGRSADEDLDVLLLGLGPPLASLDGPSSMA